MEDTIRLCAHCNSELTSKRAKKFCSTSCWNAYKKVERPCVICGKKTSHAKCGTCSQTCNQRRLHLINVDKWLNGISLGYRGKAKQVSETVRRYIKETRGTACEQCGWDKKHPVDGKCLTEIDHIDGDASNCKPSNLRVICPNCHAMTPTFRARNKKSSRER